MTTWLSLLPGWAYWLLAVLLIGGVQQYRVMDAQTELSDARAEWSDQLRLTAQANAAVILKQQREWMGLEQRLAALDTTSTEKLTHALTENDRLEHLYSAADDERRRLRIEVKIARADAIVYAAASPGSVGDAASLELSPAAGRVVWDIRGGMKADQAKIEYLQEWARSISR